MESHDGAPPNRPRRDPDATTAPEAPDAGAPEEGPRQPAAPCEPVTPYDHLWFDRRPLS